LLSRGGFLALRGLFGERMVDALNEDARSSHVRARRSATMDDAASQDRGGSPARASTVASASPVHYDVHSSAEIVAVLTGILGVAVAPTGGGSYAWYERPGDFLGLHRDIEECDATLVTCLAESSGSGGLVAYPTAVGRPLSDARREAAFPIRLEPGDAALLLGGFVPHEVAPMAQRQHRTVSLMCYRLP
jgi:hypothetical protein